MGKIKKKVDIVFVVLTYRNSADLIAFLQSIREKVQYEYKVIIVNSYYDEQSKNLIQKLAEENQCIFLNIDNKGYSFGNNYGIKYAEEYFDYNYLVVSNPDIIIERFDTTLLQESQAIYGPIIKTKNGKFQNPYRKSYSPLGEVITYIAHKFRISPLSYFYIIVNKIERELFLKKFRKSESIQEKVYALHGSFQIFTGEVIKQYSPLFNEKMFLFCEEDWLAYRMQKNKVPMYMTKNIKVLHQEDGSVSQEKKLKTTKEIQKSYIVYYDEKDNK